MSSPPPTPDSYIIFPNVSMFNSGQAFKNRAISDCLVVGVGEKLFWSLRFRSGPDPQINCGVRETEMARVKDAYEKEVKTI